MGKKGGGGDAGKAAAMDRNTARDTTYADRPDQFNPFGSVTWDQELITDPATGKKTTKWTQTQGMSSDLEGLYQGELARMKGMGDLSSGMIGRINQEMGAAPDWAQFGDVNQMNYDPSQIRQAAEDASYQRSTNRLDPRFEGEAEAMEVKLRNQGLRPGDQAYDSAMSTFGQTKNDAYEQARLGATSTGQSEAQMLWDQQMQGTNMANALRDKQIQEYLDKRGFSLGESRALSPTNDIKALSSAITGGGSSSGSSS